jgi:hypothetical protein
MSHQDISPSLETHVRDNLPEEQSTTVVLVITGKDGVDIDQVYLDSATTSSTATTENRQVGLTTVVKTTVETDTGVGVDTVTTSDADGETYTTICPQTTEGSTVSGEEDTRVYTQSVDISDISTEGVDCKIGVKFPSPSSDTPGERTHTGTLAECGYSRKRSQLLRRTGRRRKSVRVTY